MERAADPVAEQLARLRELTAQAVLAPDVQEALAAPGVSRYRRAVGFRVVERFEDLAGPAEGDLEVPERLRGYRAERVETADRDALRHLYSRLLHDGRPEEQAALINPGLLIELWDGDLAEPAVLTVWEARFPQLRR